VYVASRLDVIFPCFQKADQIEEVLRRSITVFDEAGLVFRLIVVVDGPDQDCVRNIEKIDDSRVNKILLPLNLGKGGAIRAGFKLCDADFVAFLDADLDLHPSAIVNAIKLMSDPTNSNIFCTYGSKFHEESSVNYPFVRRIVSYVYRILVRILFGLDVDDTQTGVKVFRFEAISRAIALSSENRFLFDVELLAVCNNFEYQMISMPIKLDYRFSSSINMFAALLMIGDTFRLSWRLRRAN
jgi:glycosyltransferase involved in cell wall biosynthesis